MIKALALFSGGLDSILAVRLIEEQGIDMRGICFESPFFSAQKARQSAHYIGIPLMVMDITERMLPIVLNPRHGYGKGMNPCIDCHALMFRVAGEMLKEEGARFMISGEVLGQRPMSQNLRSLSIISRESGFDGLILRPLSAKRLPETLAESQGWVNRERLLELSGRSRKPQIELAKGYGVEQYPSPAGGCLLTDVVFSRRLKDLITKNPGFSRPDLELLKQGRHFRISEGTKIVVGRNKRENEAIISLTRREDTLLTVELFPGPTTLVIGDSPLEELEVAAAITVSYSDAPLHQPVNVVMKRDSTRKTFRARRVEKSAFHRFMI
ncbi:MAG: tRNA 4-thiouridine(8) synthase ThiI [Deltaproteobacteria bacterium]|nr:tRNA 4-thiouridine(8) synthase ThiI [Deltaproteobacteria bacterium]